MQKAIPFRIPKSENRALLIQVDEGNHFYDQLHYHPEFQLSYIVKGSGILYAGNAMKQFRTGDMFLVGSNVPHVLKNDDEFYTASSEGVFSISVFLDRNSFGLGFFHIDEMQGVKKLLDESDQVIMWNDTENDLAASFEELRYLNKESLIIGFLQLISALVSRNYNLLNVEGYNNKLNLRSGKRLNKIVQYCFDHYREEIKVDEVAKMAFVSRSQFSQFFKQHTGQSFIHFLNNYRIEKACVELINSNETVNKICYSTGFRNVSNFMRQFKQFKDMSPGAYRKLWSM